MDSKCCECDARPSAVALARWVIGVVLLIAGIAKLGNVAGVADGIVSQFSKTWLPQGLAGALCVRVAFRGSGTGRASLAWDCAQCGSFHGRIALYFADVRPI